MMPALPPSFCRLPLPALRRQRQQGIASVLTMVLVGMALMASVMGAAYYIAARQSHSTSTHAQTQAQFNAWTGAHILQAYFEQLQHTDKLQDLLQLSTQPPIAVQLQASGMQGLVDASITHLQPPSADAPGRITAKITGTAAQDTRAQASAMLEVVYELPAAKEAPALQSKAAVMIKGDLSITGGTSGFVTSEGLLDIMVDGNLTISSASQALVSACAKGNITIDGGGVKGGGRLYSEQSIHLKSLTPPINVDVWGQNVKMDNSGAGTFSSIRAGAYLVNIEDSAGNIWGTAYMGGYLLGGTATGLPWRQGTLIPHKNGTVRLFPRLPAGQQQLLLDMSKLGVDIQTGQIRNLAQSLKDGAVATSLPDPAYFKAKDVYGGSIDLYKQTSAELWGYDLWLRGYHGSYAATKAAGHLHVMPSALGTITGGGNMVMLDTDKSNIQSIIQIHPSAIAGQMVNSAGSPMNDSSLLPYLRQNVAGTTPGLPGIPYCDTSMPAVNVSPYKAMANYVFEYVGDTPWLTVRNVQKNGQRLDGIYPLDGSSAVVKSLMSCGWEAGNSCNFPKTTDSHRKWVFTGIYTFPVGTMWFDAPVTLVSTATGGLINSIIAQGSVELSSGSGEPYRTLRAPSHAKDAVCNAAATPIDLCEALQSTQVSALSTLANMAVMTEQSLQINGWTIHGNLQVGKAMANAANASHIYGTVAVGLNAPGQHTNLSSGGLIVMTDKLSAEQLRPVQPPTESGEQGSSPASPGSPNAQGPIKIKWSRYL